MPSYLTLALSTGTVRARAVIFDMDGVLSDTQTIHAQMESGLLREHGIEMSPDDITREFGGVSDEEMFPRIFGRYGKRIANIDDFIERKWKSIMELAQGRVRATPGALALVETLKARRLPLGVASSSRRPFIELVLGELDIRESFAAIVSADEVERSKPDPAIYLAAARRLGTAPQTCLVIEDSINGMLAAKRAGMLCIGLVPQDSQKENYPADLLISDLRQMPIRFR